jgi:flagellar protein FlgJ
MLAAAPTELTALTGLNGLRNRLRNDEPGALREAAVQFEALVMNLMLKAARDATPGESVFDGPGTREYLELMDQHVALALARQGGLGLARMLGADEPGVARSYRAADVPTMPRVTPQRFVETFLPHAREAAAALGVDPKLLVAQAALESGWGRAALSGADGRPAHNVFAIKAGAGWRGDTVTQRTLEFVDGVAERRYERFRAYPDLAAGVADYIAVVKGALEHRTEGAADAEAYVDALTRAGYATDPDYGKKWLAVYHGERLGRAYSDAL